VIAVARTARNGWRRRLSSILGCIYTESVPPNQVWIHPLTADLPRVTGTMIIGSDRRSFPDKSRVSTKSLRHFLQIPIERTETHRDRREKQRPCAHIQCPRPPLGQGQLVKSSPRWHGGRRVGIEDYRDTQASPSRVTLSWYGLKAPPTCASWLGECIHAAPSGS